MTSDEAIAAASAHPLIGSLSDSTRRTLLAGGRIVPHRARSTILREGDAAERVYFLVQGCVRVFHRRGDFEILVKLLRAPAMFGEMEALAGIPFLEYVVALERSHTLQIPKRLFARALEREAFFATAVTRDLAERLCIATVNERALVFDNVEARLAAVVCDYADTCGMKNEGSQIVRLSFSLSQDQLARDIGASRRAVASAMRNLQHAGLVKRAGRYEIENVEALRSRGRRALGLAFQSSPRGRR